MKKSWIISKKEFLTNIKSVRMIIIIFIFTIIVIASAYGISINQPVDEPEPNIYFTHILDLDGDGWKDDLVVYVTDFWGNPKKDKTVGLLDMYEEDIFKKDIINKTTDENGRVVFKDISDHIHENDGWKYLGIRLIYRGDMDREQYFIGKDQIRIQAMTEQHDLSNKSNFNDISGPKERFIKIERDVENKDSKNDLIFHVLTPEGDASNNAKLLVNNTEIKRADKSGFIKYEFSHGPKNITIEDRYGNFSFEQDFQKERKPQYYKGPDYILKELVMLLLFIIPFLTIALGYDSISKEKETNSLFFLITRPIEKWKILIGKLFGNFASLSIPFTIINLIGVAWIWNLSGKAPDSGLIAIFLISTLGTIIIYLSLQMLISTFSKSSGTAILGGAGIWLFFNLFYFILISGISTLFGIKTGSRSYNTMKNIIDLFNPNMVFNKSINLVDKGIDYQYYTGIPNFSIYLALLLWIILPIIILTYVFQRRIAK